GARRWRSDGHAWHAGRAGCADRDRSKSAQTSKRKRDGAAQQTRWLRLGASRRWLSTGDGIDSAGKPLGRRPHAAHLEAEPFARSCSGRATRYRFDRPPRFHAGRSHRAPADRPRFRGRKRISGARRRRAFTRRDEAAESRSRARRREAEAGARLVAERASTACCSAPGQEAPDPAHVRGGRSRGDRIEARAHRKRRARQAAGWHVALSAPGREILIQYVTVTTLTRPSIFSIVGSTPTSTDGFAARYDLAAITVSAN